MIAAPHRPPARPDAPAGAGRTGRWLGPIAVAAVIAATVLGGFVVAGALPTPDVRAVTVADLATIRPLPGWEVARREAVTIETSGGAVAGEFVQLTRGSAAVDLLGLPGGAGDAEQLAVLYADRVLSSQLERLSVSEDLRSVMLPGGLDGVRFGYIGTQPGSGTAIEGSVTTAASAIGNGVVVDAWGGEGQLEVIAEEVAAMIASLEVD